MVAGVNPLRGEANLVIGDFTKILVFDVNAICLVENALDLPIYDLLGKLKTDDLSMIEARALLWAGLAKHHPCTLTEAGDVMSDAGMIPVTLALLSALAAAFGLATEGGDGKNPPKSRSRKTG